MTSRTDFPEVFAKLSSPFDADEVRSRNQAGRQLQYITARSAMNRLDEALGPEHWKDEYTPTESGLRCRIWFRLEPGGEWLWKEDGGAAAGMPEADNDEKSGYSDAFKRAAVKLGVARYLYKDGTPDYGDEAPQASQAPAQSRPAPAPQRDHPPQTQPQPGGSYGNLPRNGRALFAWTKEMESKHEVSLLQHINEWAKRQGLPGRMVDFDEDQVKLAAAEAIRKLDSLHQHPSGEASADSPEPTHQAEPLTAPHPDFPRPATGKDLYRQASEWQQKLGLTLIAPALDHARVLKIGGKMADWSGDDLETMWRIIGSKIAFASRAAVEPVSPLAREVWSKATRLTKFVYQSDAKPEPEMVTKQINSIHAELFGGETIQSLRECKDEARLRELSKCLDELIEEQANVPAGI